MKKFPPTKQLTIDKGQWTKKKLSKLKSQMSNAFGFTLVELMVVITIMAIIGVFALASFGDFGENQKLNSAVLDVQSLLRQAQANATANVKCDNPVSSTWQVEFAVSTVTINMNCREPLASPPPSPTPTPTLKKTLTLGASIVIQSVSGSGTGCPAALPFTISFDPLTGKVSLGSDERCTSLTITLINTKTTSTKALIIERGGRIYAQ